MPRFCTPQGRSPNGAKALQTVRSILYTQGMRRKVSLVTLLVLAILGGGMALSSFRAAPTDMKFWVGFLLLLASSLAFVYLATETHSDPARKQRRRQ